MSFAQPAGGASDPATVPPPPSVVHWEEPDGRIVVRATRIAEPIRVDGRLDDAAYQQVPAITQFIQQEPAEGAPVTEKTEAWILFDDDNIYVACRCWDSRPELIVANDMRRDNNNMNQHDTFGVQLDPFYDGRSSFYFYISAIGAMRDAVITDERPNNDWNAVWNGRGTKFEQGWVAEMAIPFKSLRYKPGRDQTWGIQMRRNLRSKNERVHLTRLSPAWGMGAWNHMSQAATLVGIETPASSRRLELKPYAAGRVKTDRVADPPVENRFDPDAGVDLKYGLTEGLTADFTYNTDFAEVEADEAQINLTRFALSFPEKREFFLEGVGIFNFGTVGGTSGEGGGTADAPIIFYSRRIGLSGGRAVPVIGGARLTGKAGAWSVGALNIETDDDPAVAALQTNFTVMRVRRNVLRRSTIGAIYTRRSVSTVAPGGNDVFGFDANLGFFEHMYVGGYLAKSQTEGLDGEDLNYRMQFNYNADRYGLALDRQVVGDNFNPEVGFMRREDFRRSYVQARFSPRTADNPVIRKFSYQGNFDYFTDNDNRLQSREVLGEFKMDFHSSDSMSFQVARLYEFLDEPFPVEDVEIPVGGYGFTNAVMSYTAGQQHRVSGTTSVEVGGFYDGKKRTAAFKGRVEITTQLGVEPNISLNWIDLPQGRFTSTVAGARTTFTMTPRMFVSALVQYSSGSDALSTNLRFRWEYVPGSELFVVYNDGRSTLPPRGTELLGRSLAVKITRLFRF